MKVRQSKEDGFPILMDGVNDKLGNAIEIVLVRYTQGTSYDLTRREEISSQ